MQVTKQIHAIKIPFQIPVAPGKTLDRFVYSYLIYDTEICLIDSGIKSSERVIFDYIKKMLDDLGLPETAVNPLIARSFASHLKIRDRKNL